jgi:opacity protein-like surface antigen
MKRLLTTKALIACIAICLSGTGFAQSDNPKYEFGINIGFLVYQGDLTPEKLGSFRTQKLAFGFHASRILGPAFSLRGNMVIGTLIGNDAVYPFPEYRQQRNFNFISPVTELSAQLVWNVAGRNYADKGFSPYLFAGAGVSFLNIKRDWSQINANYFGELSEIWPGLAIDAAHQPPHILPVFPVGAGMKYFFTPRWAINAEASYRLDFTDYLDGFSKAANPSRNDHYLNYAIGLIYRPFKKGRMDCPALKY